ncbi:MAG: hypothetical protein KA067_01335 [Prevotella sp.]|nr:hypothetical protein [Prevotella sp.]
MSFPWLSTSTFPPPTSSSPPGVYAVRVHTEGYGQPLYGMTNIGIRPMFGGLNLTVETYILREFGIS